METGAVMIKADTDCGVVFRCQMLNEDGGVLFPADIVAESSHFAIQHAFHIRDTRIEAGSSSERVYGFKVWHEPSAA
jgi:hypothetical protein